MSLSRAFTTRRLRLSSDEGPGEGGKPRRNSTATRASSLRHKISAPIRLIHTTNMLSYNAPDLPPSSNSNSTDSRSEDDSDHMMTRSTPPTSPDVASGGRSSSPEPNHLTSYFKNPAKTIVAAEERAPQIPKCSPSHTKKNSFDAIARSRSLSRLFGGSDLSASPKADRPFLRSPSTSTRASTLSRSSFRLATKASAAPAAAPALTMQQLSQRLSNDGHPFGQELAQVSELAEEYIIPSVLGTIDEEQQYMDQCGLAKLTADDYLGAIQSISSFFPDARHVTPLWI